MPDDAPRWLDADAAAAYLSTRVDAFLRKVRQGILPKPSLALGERTPRWHRADLDVTMKPDTTSTDPLTAVTSLAEKIEAEGRARRQAQAGRRNGQGIPLRSIPAEAPARPGR